MNRYESILTYFQQGVSLKTDKPMIFKRKETKSHGTKKIIEGIYNTDDRCLVIDDVVTSGISIMVFMFILFFC